MTKPIIFKVYYNNGGDYDTLVLANSFAECEQKFYMNYTKDIKITRIEITKAKIIV